MQSKNIEAMDQTYPAYSTHRAYSADTAPQLNKALFGSRYWLTALIFSIAMHLLIMHGLPWLNQLNSEPAGMQQITASFKTLANPTTEPIAAFEPPLPEIEPKTETPIEPIKPKTMTKPVIDKPILQSTDTATPKDFAIAQTAESTEQVETPTASAASPQPTSTPASNVNNNANNQPITTLTTNPNPSARNSQDDGLLDAYGRDLQRLCERNKQYPAIAIRRNLEGSGIVLVTFNKDGTVLRISIEQSTGEKPLDDQAMKMVEKSLASLPLPSKLNGKVMTLSVPVTFALDG